LAMADKLARVLELEAVLPLLAGQTSLMDSTGPLSQTLFRQWKGPARQKKVSPGTLTAGYYGLGIREPIPWARKLLIRKQEQNRVPERKQMPLSRVSGRLVAIRGGLMEDTLMSMRDKVVSLWGDQQGQDIAEYAVMLAVILVIVVGTIRLIGSNSNNVFSSVASSIQ
jgi:Flp pilus assembly pilin Flp